MSGKGKGKGRSKGKDKDFRKSKRKLEKHETKVCDKTIDLIRFAYDVFKYSALKYQIPENCIAIWEGPENDYGGGDFFPTICRRVIAQQMECRLQWHAMWFKPLIKKNITSKSICDFLGDCIEVFEFHDKLGVIIHVELSLAVACELILFLYSEDIDIYVKELAVYWFKGYLQRVKKEFEAADGLVKIFSHGYAHKMDLPDWFIDLQISIKYSDYKKSVNNQNLIREFYKSADICREKNKAKSKVSKPALRHKQEAPIENLQVHERLEIVTHDKLLEIYGPSAGASQNPPEETSVEQSKHSRRLSSREKRNRRYSSRPSMEKGHGQSSLVSRRTGQSSENPSALEATDAASYSLLGAKPKDPAKYRLDQSMELGHEQMSSDSPGIQQLSEFLPPTDELSGTRPEKLAEYSRGSYGLQTGESSSLSSLEQRFGSLSLNLSRPKRSHKKTINVAASDDHLQINPGTSNLEPRKQFTGSASEEEEDGKSDSRTKKELDSWRKK